MRLFITGDKHAEFDFLKNFCEVNKTSREDVLIILGDAGILYFGNKTFRERRLKDYISNFPITLFCVRGNHEERAEDRSEMTKKEIFGNDVYFDLDYPNILYAIDGFQYVINGETFLVIGGAYSVDKFYRLMTGNMWFSNEQLNEQEMNKISEFVRGKHFNHILAHTCPFTWEPTYLFLGGVDQSTIDSAMERWLEHVVYECSFDNYWFGHFHGDNMDLCGDGKVHMLFNDIKEIV